MSHWDTFKDFQKKQKAYELVLALAGWDSNTEAPRQSIPYRSEMLSIISGEHFSLMTDAQYKKALDALYEEKETLNDQQFREVQKAKKSLDKIIKIPKAEYVEYSKLTTMAQRIWEEAKEKDDFEHFKPYLKKIINYKKRMIKFRDDKAIPYNVLLDDFEEGMTIERYDAFFQTIKDELVPFVKQVLAKSKDDAFPFLDRKYPKKDQKDFVDYVTNVFGFDFNRGVVKESVHPFTWNTHSQDVRLTTRYMEDYLPASIYAAMHELGHAMYEQQIDETLDSTNLNTGASMGVHESQSRFYENIIGRSRAFWDTHFSALKKRFPDQLHDVDAETFTRASNRVEESFIRVEADELTYPLHILIRYEIERDIFNNGLGVDGLERVWNEKMKAYLNLDVNRPSDGVLQDVHWSDGMFGYFPTYALGSAYAAQIYYALNAELDLDQTIRDNDIARINQWFKENIHCYGSRLTPDQILNKVTGESFNPKYYIRYLKEKYSKLYLED